MDISRWCHYTVHTLHRATADPSKLLRRGKLHSYIRLSANSLIATLNLIIGYITNQDNVRTRSSTRVTSASIEAGQTHRQIDYKKKDNEGSYTSSNLHRYLHIEKV